MSCPHAYSDAAYVLGALSPAERFQYESHLADCAGCAAAVARLAPLPGLLSRVDPASLRPREPDPAPLARLLEAVATRRRRLRRAVRLRYAAGLAVAVALAVIGTGVWLGVAPPGPGAPPGLDAPAAVAMVPVVGSSPVAAEVAVAETAGGTQVWMHCRYEDQRYHGADRTFRLVAIGLDGASETLGSWRAGPGDEVSLAGMTSLTGTELVRLELRGLGDTPLLAHQLSGGS